MKNIQLLSCILLLSYCSSCTDKPTPPHTGEPKNQTITAPESPIGKDSTTKVATPTPGGEAAVREVVQTGCINELTLIKGQTLTLKLPATAGTGYLWQLAAPAAQLKQDNADALKFEPADKTPSTKPNKVGGQQLQVLKFEAVAEGSSTLNWSYVRPTDPKKPSNQCAIKVTVKAK